MTEVLLQKLEEKMMLLLSEVEDLRREVLRLQHENSHFKYEKDQHTRKVSDILALLDSVAVVDNAASSAATLVSVKPVLLAEYAQST